MTAAPAEAPLLGCSTVPRKRFSNLRSVLWRIDLGILPNSPSASIDDLRRVAADTRRRYANLRRRLLVDPHLIKDGEGSSDLVMDNPLSQNPESLWGRFFKNAELEKTVDKDLLRLYPEDGSYFQTSACQTMLRRILLVWCLWHPEYGYRQGMHELLAPLVYVLHVDLHHLLKVRNLFEDYMNEDFDGLSFPESDTISNYRSRKLKDGDLEIDKENDNLSERNTVHNLDELDPDIKDIFLLSDSYGAEGELGVVLSERFMEHDAYCMFDTLMSGAHGVVVMADFFSPSVSGSNTGLPPVIEASTALYHLLCIVDSSLHTHLVDLGVEPQFFALRWLRVLFGREFGLEDLLVIWDELFSFPNDMIADSDVDYHYNLLCSTRGAFIAAFAVSMILYLRNSLLATENPTSCLQRLLNIPNNLDIIKLINKAISLQELALNSNYLPSSSQKIYSKNKSAITRGYSLPAGSSETSVNSVLDSYWEEKWRVLYSAEELHNDTNKEKPPKRTMKKILVEKFGLSGAESVPSATSSGGKDSQFSVGRNLLDDLSEILSSVNEPEVLAGSHKIESQLVNSERDESVDEMIMGTKSDCIGKDTLMSEEKSSAASPAMSTNNQGNDHENYSEKSSVTSNSFIDYDEETSNMEDSRSQSDINQHIECSKVTASINTELEQGEEATQKEQKPLGGKFQWFSKLGRSSVKENLEKARSSSTSKSNGTGDSVIDKKVDVDGERVIGSLKNLGHSMLEHIQVIEAVFHQDGGQSTPSEHLSDANCSDKGQDKAMEALKELRTISNILSEI